MNRNKFYGIFVDLWDEDDVTTSIAWGLCGYRGAHGGPGGKSKAEGSKSKARATLLRQ